MILPLGLNSSVIFIICTMNLMLKPYPGARSNPQNPSLLSATLEKETCSSLYPYERWFMIDVKVRRTTRATKQGITHQKKVQVQNCFQFRTQKQ